MSCDLKIRYRLLGQSGTSIAGGQRAKDAGIIREGLCSGIQNRQRPLDVAGGGGLVRTPYRPVGPDGLHRAPLLVAQVLPAPSTISWR